MTDPTIDLNADLGESFGPWRMGDDRAMLGIVTSANIACGFHAGDPAEMARTIAACAENGVAIGAHPGLDDLAGFGRRRILDTPPERMRAMILYQIGALQALARAAGQSVTHVKLHGALSNMAMTDRALSDLFAAAVAELADPCLRILAVAGTEIHKAAAARGLPVVAEVFADRTYEDDGTLVSRSRPGAVIHDPATAADHVLRMVEEQAITSINGVKIPVRPESVCVHGDTPDAVRLAAAVRRRLEDAGVRVTRF